MLAAKELSYIMISLVRGRSADRLFHQRMLRELFSPWSLTEVSS
jgi:hypothetical protein